VITIINLAECRRAVVAMEMEVLMHHVRQAVVEEYVPDRLDRRVGEVQEKRGRIYLLRLGSAGRSELRTDVALHSLLRVARFQVLSSSPFKVVTY
jgi:alpha-galactosidase